MGELLVTNLEDSVCVNQGCWSYVKVVVKSSWACVVAHELNCLKCAAESVCVSLVLIVCVPGVGTACCLA